MTENRPEHETATMHINDPVADWCPHCAKTTLLRYDITALVSDGPRRVGEYAVCHECGYSPYATPEATMTGEYVALEHGEWTASGLVCGDINPEHDDCEQPVMQSPVTAVYVGRRVRIGSELEPHADHAGRRWDDDEEATVAETATVAPTYAVGDRVRTLVDAPAAGDCSPAMPAGSLGTVVEVRPGGVGVDFDADPWHLAADYTLAEIAPAPTLRDAVIAAVRPYALPARSADHIAGWIAEDVLEVVAPFLAADRTRILTVVAAWAHSAAEFGGVDHGDLIRALEVHGYTLPDLDDTEENDR